MSNDMHPSEPLLASTAYYENIQKILQETIPSSPESRKEQQKPNIIPM